MVIKVRSGQSDQKARSFDADLQMAKQIVDRAQPPREEVVKRRSRGLAKRKPPQSIRFPDEVLEFFGHKTPGWQQRINAVLLDHVIKSEEQSKLDSL